MPLLKRFVGSCIDKIAIAVLFVFFFFIISPYGAASDIGSFIGLMTTKPYLYDYMPSGNEFRALDQRVMFYFILLNALYYSVSELILKGSLGKRIMGGMLTCEYGGPIDTTDILKRTLFATLLMFALMWMHNAMNLSIIFTILLFFMILDASVFLKKQSLIDILSKTTYSINIAEKGTKGCNAVVETNEEEGKCDESISIHSSGDVKTDSNNKSDMGDAANKVPSRLNLIKILSALLFITIPLAFGGMVYLLSTNTDKEYKRVYNELKYVRFLAGGDLYVHYAKARYFAKRIIQEDDNDTRPKPRGKFVCGYEGHGESKYYTRSKRLVPVEVPIYSKEYRLDYWGRRSKNIIGYRKVNKAGIYEIPHPFEFKTRLYVYNISTQKNIFAGKDTASPNILKDLREDIKRCGLEAASLNIDGKKTLSFHDGSFIRSIFFNNQKAYVLDVVPSPDAKTQSEIFLQSQKTRSIAMDLMNSLITEPLDSQKSWLQLKLYCPIALLILSCVCFFFLQTIKHKKCFCKSNKLCHVLFMYCVVCILVNLIVVIIQWNYLRNHYGDEGLLYLLFFGVSLFFNLISTIYFNHKSRLEFQSDILAPSFIKCYLSNRVENDIEKKSVVAFIIYPFWIIGQLPFGLFILLYVIPLSLMTFIGIECRHLFSWIYGKGTYKDRQENDRLGFKDYYLILDLTSNATILDVEKAFNHKIASYNLTEGKNRKNNYYYDLQEAYMVLSSEKRLRPAYDVEYDLYDRAGVDGNYSFTNKKLERDIKSIRKSLRNDKTKAKSFVVNNVVLISLIAWIIGILLLLFLIGEDSHNRSSTGFIDLY